MNEGLLLTCEIAACLSAAGILFSKNIFISVMLLLTCCLGIAGIFGALGAPYMLIAQIAVYGGGIVVLFLFAIMIAGKDFSSLHPEWSIKGILPPALLFAFLLRHLPDAGKIQIADTYSAEKTGKLIEDSYLFPFELSGVLLLVALIAAISISIQKPETNES